MAGWLYISELQSTGRVRDLVEGGSLFSTRIFRTGLCRFATVLTSYHKVTFCAAEQLSVDQPLDLGLGEGRLEV